MATKTTEEKITNTLTESEIKKEILTDVTPVDETKIEFAEEQPQQAQPDPQPDEFVQPQQVTMNLADFGQIITNTYCGISDTVYKRIKKTDTAPKWDSETKEAIKEALNAYLSTVNVVVKPIYGLLATLATVEIVRYTMPVQQQLSE